MTPTINISPIIVSGMIKVNLAGFPDAQVAVDMQADMGMSLETKFAVMDAGAGTLTFSTVIWGMKKYTFWANGSSNTSVVVVCNIISFKGKISNQFAAGEIVSVTVTKPDNTIEVVQVASNNSGEYSFACATTDHGYKIYSAVGEDHKYKAANSVEVSF